MSAQPLPWDKYAKQAPTSGPWTKYAEPSAASPIPPPPIAQPHINMHQVYLGSVGVPTESDGTVSVPDEMESPVTSMAKNLFQVSAPGIASSILQKVAPKFAAKIPAVARNNATPVDQLPKQLVENFALGSVPEGELESGAARTAEPRPAAIPKPSASPSTALGRVGEVAMRRASHIPGVQAVKDLDYIVRGDKPGEPAVPQAKAAPIPETNGIQWGTGGEGPLDLRGKMIPLTPEQLNPALTSESRTLPGQVGKEVIGRVARPEAIPPRSGLMLPSAKEPISTVQHPNFPTPESRAASDASFARRHPNADFQSGMSPDAERAWQESAGFKSEPAIDIGAKVRAANPEPTRAESRTGPIWHSEWPPPEPEGPYSQVPKRPRGIIDVQDDAAVKQEVQNRIASSDQKWMAQASAERAARNSPAVRKGVLTGQVDELGIPISPVGKPTGPRGLSPAAPEATDLTPEWTKALEDLKAKKGQKGNLGD